MSQVSMEESGAKLRMVGDTRNLPAFANTTGVA